MTTFNRYDYYSISEVSKRIGVIASRDQLANEGHLPDIEVGRAYLYRKERLCAIADAVAEMVRKNAKANP